MDIIDKIKELVNFQEILEEIKEKVDLESLEDLTERMEFFFEGFADRWSNRIDDWDCLSILEDNYIIEELNRDFKEEVEEEFL